MIKFAEENPFRLPVKWDHEEECIVDAKGVVVIHCGSWLGQEGENLNRRRGKYLVELLNSQAQKEDQVTEEQKARNPWGRNGKPK